MVRPLIPTRCPIVSSVRACREGLRSSPWDRFGTDRYVRRVQIVPARGRMDAGDAPGRIFTVVWDHGREGRGGRTLHNTVFCGAS
jgi:hypothetical protein